MSQTYDPQRPWVGVRRIGVSSVALLPPPQWVGYSLLRSRRNGRVVGSLSWVGGVAVVLIDAGAPADGAAVVDGLVALIVRDVLVTTFTEFGF